MVKRPGLRLAEVVDEHLLHALEEFDLDFEDLADILSEQAPWTLWGCAFEDFLTRRWNPDGRPSSMSTSSAATGPRRC